jgi:DNA-binding FrmR family transcriptional regulator
MRRIIGQLQGVERMFEADRDCIEILTQIISIRRGLKSLSQKLIHEHLEHCLLAGPDAPSTKERLQEILGILDRYVE